MPRLGHTDAHCATLLALPPPPPPLALEALQGYVMLVSGHFQGFCRDLYTECSQICAAVVPAGLLAAVQKQFATEVKLNTGNPTVENIRKDFERFEFPLDLAAADPLNPVRVTHLVQLNYWRNVVAHQKTTPPPPPGVPAVLTLADVQTWRASCDGLAKSLDGIMHREMHRILGVPPW
jgi:hypothetical protein